MTFILDMASGREYLGDELSCPRNDSRQTSANRQRHDDEPAAQLQLATVATGTIEPSQYIDLADLIQALDD